VSIRGEAVFIPARIYSPEPNSTSSLSDVQRTILACLYTRHYHGFVREKQLPALFAAQFPWVPPCVLQLVGEYVVEIIETIAKQIEELDLALCSEFAEENPAFISVTRSRVISYWDCYYRWRYPKLRDYPGYRVMSTLNLWSGRDARHILKHQQ
jgi:hypothetical protein